MNRRQALMHMLFGAGLVGLRSLATGLPASILINPQRALAETTPPVVSRAPQFMIYSTSAYGDPINCNAPGTYDDPNIAHPADPSMAAANLALGGAASRGAAVWATLPKEALARCCFFHHGTYTLIHVDEAKTMRLMGATAAGEMLPSLIARRLAGPLGTIREQPIALSGNPLQTVYYQGAPQPLLSPTSLAAMLSAPQAGLGSVDLLKLRDRDLDALHALVKENGGSAQRSFIDKYATSRDQLRTLQHNLLGSLGTIKDNSADSQIQAAILLFQMKVTPLVLVQVPFGGDNHSDVDLAGEVKSHGEGVATIGNMLAALAAAKLQDQVTFCMINVFGRTMVAGQNDHGRNHNPSHSVGLMIGKHVKGSVIGGVGRPGKDKEYAALPIDAATGKAATAGDISYGETFASLGKTVAAAAGLAAGDIDSDIISGKVVPAALNG